MSAALDDAPAGQHDDLVAIADGAQAVGDDQAGAAPTAEVVVDDGLGLGVQGAGGLVEHQQAGIADQRPGDLQPLPLAAGEVPGSLGDDRVVAAPPPQQVAMDRGARPAWISRSLLIRSSQRVRLSRTVPWNMAIRSSTSATELTKTSRGISRDRLAVVEDLAAPGLVEPVISRASVDLPLPEPPTRAIRWPGRITSEKSLMSGSSTVRL